MNFDQYRRTIIRRTILMRVCWLVYLGLTLFMRFGAKQAVEHPAFSMLMGGMIGGLLAMGIFFAKYWRALKDDTLLRRLYNEEHDERMQAIRARAGFPVTVVMSLAMIGAGLIATFFNMTVALTLVLAAVAQMLVSLAIKFWCMRTM